jgi:hypothetical protein
MIHRMLSNHLYIGKVHHRGEFFQGEHSAIIEQKLWDDVQRILSGNRNGKGYKKKEIESPFKGLLKCGYCGGALGITYSKKKDRCYTYYVCIKDEKKILRECPLVSIPTGEADRIVLQQLNSIFKTPSMLAKVYAAAMNDEVGEKNELLERKKKLLNKYDEMKTEIIKCTDGGLFELRRQFKAVGDEIAEIEQRLGTFGKNAVSCRDITEVFESIESLWEELFPLERYRLVHLLIEKIILTRNSLKLEIKTHGVASLIKEIQSGNPEKFRADDAEKRIITLEIPIIIKHKRGRKTIIAPDSELPINKTPVQEMMLKALARAHSWLELIESGEVATISQLAEKLNLDKSYVGKIFRLINLAPDIQEAIITGNEPDGLSLEKLRENMPDNWQEQRQLFCADVKFSQHQLTHG